MTFQTKAITPLVTNRFHNTLLVQLPSRLTVIEAVSFRKYFQELLEDSSITKIILDFGQTTIIDSSGIGSLITNIKSAKAKNIQLTVWSPNPQVKLAFSLVGLDKILNIQADTEAIIPTVSRKSQQRPPLTHASVRSPMKRTMDIVGAILGLGVTAVLFVPIAIAIKLDSPGPILFSQTRCGWMGRRFRIWKFRSMVTNAEALKSTINNQASGAFFKNDHDPRITRVGRFLRKTSLDEFPQFWNILKGDMSLIGTRPPTQDELEQYEIFNWQRLDVRPGLSGEWQVNGRSKIRNFEDVVKLDLRYQENWSLGYDVKLILKTFIVVFNKDSGAA
ncbi:sugar transferase [Anabaena cylindrica FACHB-243]|uniref:Anti-sigma-factor antagonist and sugar transfersase n=1 Tax=Anabaena cylindrica (strain ATCC 27899 / PCC 7122) TaxID=272123 RepID=K9ZHC8_ANACC|nr:MULTISPECIES: sugar transferase [Anabaena]AFZ58643.1 anti-sigma-factor antagonist and sugar transfersase [Anabaena cylindrica PCC 7122]MBD2419988.1 sugar transferase [Anabaena cylindrica FACHB-243]MBY5282896.1 STAS domain-containing protein [Anabaena sp. CCAP 1446/1C]MBY5310394.1 STAS domain-containing protein [Anabaena sp. CCAP 1446/1C]MCM2407118.1 sugar transferase [Anabaena sp. CCAP 1446/1C]